MNIRAHQIQALAVALFVGVVLVMPPASPGWITYALALFGIANTLLVVPGTRTIRVVAAVASFTVLISQEQRLVLWASLLAWLVWPPAFTAAWALSRRPREASMPTGNVAGKKARIALTAIIVAVAVASIAYRLIVVGRLQQTAALFVGIPALLAIVVVFHVSPRSATGVACKAVTVGLLVSLVFLGEGMLCVVMSAPLFYLVAIGVAQALEFIQTRRTRQTTLYSSLILLTILPLSIEGVLPSTTIRRDETVVATKIVHSSAAAIAQTVFQSPRFDRPIPWFLRAGFPRPTVTAIEKASDGIRWQVRFRGGEMRITGMEPRTGDLILVLDEARPDHVRWRALSDTSHMTHFLHWREASVEWTPVDRESSRITWTIRYERGLDPAWYFGPLERYAVLLAANYLIESVATP